MKRLVCVFAVALVAIVPVFAEPLASIPNPRVRDGTWVTDMPRALRSQTVAQLNAMLDQFHKTTGGEMAVVVVSSLDGLSVEEAAVKLFERWGIGKKGKDNGLLLLWSTGDRRVRVEVGYGLEGQLPDGKVGAILDSYVIPRFRSGDFDGGILAGVQTLTGVANNVPIELPSPRSSNYIPLAQRLQRERDWGPLWYGLLGGIPTTLAGLVGFRKLRRYRRRRCQSCGARMQRLSEAADDEVLEPGQRAEEAVGSVDYDVWKCGSCGNHFTLRYPKWMTSYDSCPQCSNRTKSSTETVIEPATRHGNGRARVDENCGFCNYHCDYEKVLPQLPEPSSSSSSSSSGGSSFGGGSSGGGGASRGY